MHTIAGATTSTAVFIGWTMRGVADRAMQIGSVVDYQRLYGGLEPSMPLSYAIPHFFANGGTDAYVIRIESPTGHSAADPTTRAAFNAAVLDQFASGKAADRLDAFNVVCVPGANEASLMQRLSTLCRIKRAFLIVDCSAEAQPSTVMTQAAALFGPDAHHAALYFPWVKAPDPLQRNALRAFPPCGYIAGLYARMDRAQGVWKAPAGRDATLHGVVGPAIEVSDVDNQRLNALGINCLRTLPNVGIAVWGARTASGGSERASEWQYIPVRRFALYLEKSLSGGTEWARFETNGAELWAQLRLDVANFLQGLFKRGAFQGASAREAYFVRCGHDTMSQADIDGGILNIEIGVAVLKPAEFVVIQIRQLMHKPP